MLTRNLPVVLGKATPEIPFVSPRSVPGLLFAYEFHRPTLMLAGQGMNPVSANNDPVGLAADLSGRGENATQPNAAARPSYKTPNAVGTNPAITGTTTVQWLDTGVSLGNQEFTIIVVAKTPASQMAFAGHNRATSSNYLWFGTDGANQYPTVWVGNGSSSAGVTGMTPSPSTTGVFSVVSKGSYGRLFVNGAYDGSVLSTRFVNSVMAVGSPDYRGLNGGNVLAIYCWGRCLTPAERMGVEAYGATLSGVSLSATEYSVVAGSVGTSPSIQSAAQNTWVSNVGTTTAAEALIAPHPYRIRQAGSLLRVGLKVATLTGITAMYFKVWRKNGTTYDLVGTSENVLSKLPAATKTGWVLLSSPIAGVQEGDCVGYRVEWSGGASAYNFYTNAGTINSYYVLNTTPSSTGYAWESQAATTDYHPLVLCVARPYFSAIGDSLVAGHPAHYSYIETTDTNSIPSSMPYQLSQLLTGTPAYQNLGIGGQTTAQIAARVGQYLLDIAPTNYAILEGGVNDIAAGNVTQSQFLANWAAMLDAAVAAGVAPVVLKILPWTAGTNAQMLTRDAWNAALASLVASSYPTALVVDASTYVGVDRAGGTPATGNYWDINPLYNSGDNVHLNATGYGRLAQAIYDAGVR